MGGREVLPFCVMGTLVPVSVLALPLRRVKKRKSGIPRMRRTTLVGRVQTRE